MAILARHPYFKNLLKMIGYIVVGYNTLFLCALGPLIALIIIGFALGGGSEYEDTATPARQYTTVSGDGADQLLSIKVSGVILGDASDSGTPFSFDTGLAYGYEIKDKLYDAARDDSIKGVVLEINSPGGTIYGSRAIADGVKFYRETAKKPVYAFISGLGASGGYWASVSADKVLADPGSEIGSIGVILGPFKYYDKPVSETGSLLEGGVVTQNGIQTVTLTAGKSKDVGNPYRRLTQEEINQMQLEVNNDYDSFVAYVAERRKLTEAVIRGQIGAMAYGTKTAAQLKLIDAAANREEAYQDLAKAADVADSYRVVREQTPASFFSSLLGAVMHKPERKAATQADINRTVCGLSQTKMAFYGSASNYCTE